MTDSNRSVDAQRLTLILHDLRLPAIKQTWPDIAVRADKDGPPRASLRPWPNTRSPNATGGASSGISRKPSCRPERRSTASRSMPCR